MRGLVESRCVAGTAVGVGSAGPSVVRESLLGAFPLDQVVSRGVVFQGNGLRSNGINSDGNRGQKFRCTPSKIS